MRAATLATHVTEVFSSGTDVKLKYRRLTLGGSPQTVTAKETKILLVPVGSATRTPVNG